MRDFWNGALTLSLAVIVVTVLSCVIGLGRIHEGGDE
jgi:hypothetical protein